MSNYEQIMHLFNENKLNESLEQINRILEFEECEIHEEIKYLEVKIRIHEILNLPIEKVIIRLADNLFETDEFGLAKKYLEKILKKNATIFKYLWRSCSGSGNLVASEKYGLLYLTELYTKKRFKQMLDFLESYVSSGGLIETRDEFRLKAIVGMGDINSLDQIVFSNEVKSYLDGNSISKKVEQYELFLKLTAEKRRYWKPSKSYHEVRILMTLNEINKIENKKKFINEIFDRLIQYPEEKSWYRLIIAYSLKFERKALGIKVIHLLESAKTKFNIKHGLEKKLKIQRENIEVFPDIREEEIEHTKVDLGTDLFRERNVEDNVFEKINRIERDIRFLKETTENKTDLDVLYAELKKLDENNDLLKDHYDERYIEHATRTSLKRKNIGEIELDLLKELGRYSKAERNTEEDERAGLIRGGKKYLDLISEDDFKENIKDYYMAFFWLGLPEICCYSIDRYLQIYVNIPLERTLVLNYLKIEAMIVLESFYEASDLCEELLFSRPMVDEEKINIMYLLGEISLKLNRKDKAHEAFTWVTTKNPKYRLAKMRLKKIEQGQ